MIMTKTKKKLLTREASKRYKGRSKIERIITSQQDRLLKSVSKKKDPTQNNPKKENKTIESLSKCPHSQAGLRTRQEELLLSNYDLSFLLSFSNHLPLIRICGG